MGTTSSTLRPKAITTPVVAYRMSNATGTASLHHERTRAEQAAVDHHGTVTELIELTPALRALIAAQPINLPE